jgi:hypothetical protein
MVNEEGLKALVRRGPCQVRSLSSGFRPTETRLKGPHNPDDPMGPDLYDSSEVME